MEASNIYNIEALWQRHRDLSMNSEAISPVGLAETSESQPSDVGNSVCLLSEIPRGFAPFLSKQQIHRNQCLAALKDMSRLLQLVTEQEKKYGDRLSPHSNFYRRHMMVQQFIQSQLRTKPSPTRQSLSLTIACAFGRGQTTARNILRWGNSWVDEKVISERKNRDDHDSWMYDVDLNDAMRKFAKIQGDRTYCLI